MLEVIVKPNSSKDEIVKQDGIYKVRLKAKAEKGEANKALIKLFKKKLGMNVKIVRGFRSRKKILKIVV